MLACAMHVAIFTACLEIGAHVFSWQCLQIFGFLFNSSCAAYAKIPWRALGILDVQVFFGHLIFFAFAIAAQ